MSRPPPCSASCPTTQTTRSGFWSWRTAYLSPQTSGSHVFLLLLLRLKRAAARCRKSSVCVLQCLTLFTYQTDARQLGQLRFSSSVTTEIRQRTERAAMFVRSVWRLRDADIFKCAYFPLRTACLLSYGKKNYILKFVLLPHCYCKYKTFPKTSPLQNNTVLL